MKARLSATTTVVFGALVAPIFSSDLKPLVKDVRSVAGQGSVNIIVDVDPAPRYKAFTLRNPFRVVVDLIGVRSTFARKTIQVRRSGVRQVRVAQFNPDSVRIVLDGTATLTYNVQQQDKSVVIAAAPAQSKRFVPGTRPRRVFPAPTEDDRPRAKESKPSPTRPRPR